MLIILITIDCIYVISNTIFEDMGLQTSRRVTRSMTLSGNVICHIVSNNETSVNHGSKKRNAARTCERSIQSKTLKFKSTSDSRSGQSRHEFPSINATSFGLIQESIANNLYHLCIQAMLWNQTSGRQARPVFFEFIRLYPTPEHLVKAPLSELTALLHPWDFTTSEQNGAFFLHKRGWKHRQLQGRDIPGKDTQFLARKKGSRLLIYLAWDHML